MTMAWILLLVVLAVLGLGFALFVAPYNAFVRQRNVIQESWRQVDVELNRRYELIPNLVETVRAYAAHERNTIEQITRLRGQAMQMSQSSQAGVADPSRAAVEQQLTGAVHSLVLNAEAYPELRSNQNFLELQRQLAETEDRIAAGRRFYNANVRAYNTRIESVPSNLVASMFHFEKATYFEANDAVRQAPEVNLGEFEQQPNQAGRTGGRAAAGTEQAQPALGTGMVGEPLVDFGDRAATDQARAQYQAQPVEERRADH